jgi:hypothetical protein
MIGVLTIQFNDNALAALGVIGSEQAPWQEPSITTGLEQVITQGITRRGQVLTWASSHGDADTAPGRHGDLTGWEASDSSFHIEDHVPVTIRDTDGRPDISDADQRELLGQGLTFGMRFARLIFELEPPAPVRCIINANETCSTFRFHQIRPDESWNMPDLDSYKLDKMIVIDIEPARARHVTDQKSATRTSSH